MGSCLLRPSRLLALFLVCCAPRVASAQDEGFRIGFGALAFGDLYGVASNHDPDNQGAAGFVLRRGYLTSNMDFSESLDARVRLEINQDGEFESYGYEIDFKDLYLRWTIGRQRLTFGLAPSLAFDLIEGIWGLRHLMRTPMDLQGVASRDTGVRAEGPLNASGSLSYRAMVGAGVEFGNETGDGRKWMGALTVRPADGWTLDFYGSYERLEGETDRATGQGFVSYQGEAGRWGFQYSYQDRQSEEPLQLASGFVVADAGDGVEVLVRVDRLFEPSPSGDNISYIPFDPDAPATMLLTGVQFEVVERLFLLPNVVATWYDRNDEGEKPTSDLMLRLSFFVNFE